MKNPAIQELIVDVGLRANAKGRPVICSADKAEDIRTAFPSGEGIVRIFQAPSNSLAWSAADSWLGGRNTEDEDRRLTNVTSELVLPNGETLVLVHVDDEDYEDFDSFIDPCVEAFNYGGRAPTRVNVLQHPLPQGLAPRTMPEGTGNPALVSAILHDLSHVAFENRHIIQKLQAGMETLPGAKVSFASRDLDSCPPSGRQADVLTLAERSLSQSVLLVAARELQDAYSPEASAFDRAIEEQVEIRRIEMTGNEEPDGP